MSEIDVTIECVLTARFTYRGVAVEAKTEPTEYESGRKKLLKLVREAKEAIDRAKAQGEFAEAGV